MRLQRAEGQIQAGIWIPDQHLAVQDESTRRSAVSMRHRGRVT